MANVTYDHVTKSFDGTTAVNELTLDIADGEFMVLVGPSGCGKSTALRMLAGLEKVTDGRILIGERIVNNVAPQSRDIAMVFQSYALYPHMTVYDNLAFGLRNQKVPKKDIDRRVRKAAAFLMDEPLSNLDAKLRVQTRAEILKLQRNLDTTTIYVTHDQVEAMTMGDRIAVMRLGVLQQVGSPEDLYEQPANVFVAGFIGSPAMNLVPASVLEGVGGDDRIAGFRPEHIRIGRNGGSGETISFDGQVEVVEYLGDEQLVHFARKDQMLQAKLPVEEKVSAGDNVTFVLPRAKLYLFNAETEERISR